MPLIKAVRAFLLCHLLLRSGVLAKTPQVAMQAIKLYVSGRCMSRMMAACWRFVPLHALFELEQDSSQPGRCIVWPSMQTITNTNAALLTPAGNSTRKLNSSIRGAFVFSPPTVRLQEAFHRWTDKQGPTQQCKTIEMSSLPFR